MPPREREPGGAKKFVTTAGELAGGHETVKECLFCARPTGFPAMRRHRYQTILPAALLAFAVLLSLPALAGVCAEASADSSPSLAPPPQLPCLSMSVLHAKPPAPHSQIIYRRERIFGQRVHPVRPKFVVPLADAPIVLPISSIPLYVSPVAVTSLVWIRCSFPRGP